MKFKSKHLEAQFNDRPMKLREIVFYFDTLAKELGKEAVVTRVTDRVAKESGVHPAGRAVDCRDEIIVDKKSVRMFTDEQAKEIVDKINEKFPRKDKKLVAMHHVVAGSAKHFHFQIPINWS